MYKISSILAGHEADVRNVVTFSKSNNDTIVTVSRDTSCRVWTRNENSIEYNQSNIFYGHARYIASVCYMEPTEKYPNGLVVTGGHDKIILVFDFDSPEPILKLEGHQDTVCSLDAGKFGTILSGSWDKTAKVWINGKTVMELNGHAAAVWTVKMMPDQGLMLTGSADKTIKLWKAGKCEKTYEGHQDCVRCIAILSSNEFLSCSNDGTIRRWILAGDCVHIYKGHTNFIYSISVIPNTTNSFVSAGEDRCIKVWKDGSCAQTIALPCQSIWCVSVLENGDIVAGSNDSLARIFSCDPLRQGTEEVIKEFEETVANQAIPAAANMDLGEIKTDQLPGPEALLQPGTRKDQTKLIKKSGIVEAYQWDGSRWQKIGDVTGAAGVDGNTRTSGKQVYEGKEYDYVFNVDIAEGQPHLKLPFNVTDDPWFAAQKFLEKNDISQNYLDQVADFIIKNTKGVTIGTANVQYSDPFTGGGRYVPGSSNTNINSSGSDPFTGGGRYVPGGSSNPSTGSNMPQQKCVKKYFPERSYLKFTNAKPELMISKLTELNAAMEQVLMLTPLEIQTLNDVLNDILKGSINIEETVYQTVIGSVQKLSNWPVGSMIPALDIIRMLLVNERFSRDLFGGSHANEFVDKLLKFIRNTEPISHSLLVYRIYSNCFIHNQSAIHMYRRRKDILECCGKCTAHQNKNLNIVLSTFIVNTSVYCHKNNGEFEEKIEICNLIVQLLSSINEAESVFRLLVAIGTLLHDNDDVKTFLQTLDIVVILKNVVAKNYLEKVNECATQIIQLFAN